MNATEDWTEISPWSITNKPLTRYSSVEKTVLLVDVNCGGFPYQSVRRILCRLISMEEQENSDRRPWEGCGNSVQLALSSTQWINYVANVDEAVTGHQYVHRHHEECQTEGGETSKRFEYRMMTFMLSSNIVYP